MYRLLMGICAIAVREANKDDADLVAISNGVIAYSICAGVAALASPA